MTIPGARGVEFAPGKMNSSPKDVEQLLRAISLGDQSAAEQLFPLLYDELHRLAEAFMKRERVGHTLQPTALLHEAWLKMVQPGVRQAAFKDRQHFLATAAVAMRQVLVNHAKARQAQKRGGLAHRQACPEIVMEFETAAVDLMALDEALLRLAEQDARQARLVELRFFGGLTVEEAANILGISLRTAHMEWAHARAWLRGQLDGSH